MAHFAELDDNNIVLRVIVVSDEETQDRNGIESEEIGVAFCKKLFGVNTKWKQASYNSKIRVRFAAIGYSYNEALDAFVPPQPYPSWVLNASTANWDAPFAAPDLTQEQIDNRHRYLWNEDQQNWELCDRDFQPVQN